MHPQVIAVRSTPEDAHIFVDGEPAGSTPAQIALARGSDHSVFLKKAGYRPELVVVHANRTAEGLDYLTPWEIDVRLAPVTAPGRDLEVEVETDEP